MTGPEHYREAEENLAIAAGAEGDSNTERFHLAAAQVHATLALAAATIAAPYVPEGDASEEWLRVTSAAEGGAARV